MVSGLIIIACIGVGVLIWKFIMGNPSNFEGGNMKEILEHFRSSIPRGAVVPVLLGMLLMVCFLLKDFVISQAAGKLNWTLYDKDTQVSNKVKLMKLFL
jgi:biopolymer transport protein ExbB